MKYQKKLAKVVGLAICLAFANCSGSDKDPQPEDISPEGPTPTVDEVKAFPGADGFGQVATGGRGGKVYYVTNLNDSGIGSLRDAVNRTGARYILFNISGNIELRSELKINNPNITIAGQTAPGDGITIKNYPVTIAADNVIIRYIRFRMGDTGEAEGDALWGRYQRNIIIDHCSMSWSTDEAASFYSNENFTLQWSILSESLRNSVHNKGAHGYGGIWGGQKASFHHNLLAHHDSRNPRFNGGGRSGMNGGRYSDEHVDFRNNVIYNWGNNSAYGGENGKYNMVNNYYKPGPATPSSKNKRIMQVSFESNPTWGAGYGTFYIAGNYMHNNATVTADNWNGGVDYDSSIPLAQRANVRLQAPIEYQISTEHTAEQAYEKVLAFSGASLKRDAVDLRIVENVKNRSFTAPGSRGSTNGLIDSQSDVGGWPELKSTAAPVDTDNDGMPDDWEIAHKLDPNKPEPNGRHLSTAYDNVEVYINSLVKTITEEQKK
ncbi:pectate lyase [Rufibacter roseus]|uniref:Pectate lyase n=1 Tax=Rufibacter roseus TaxID=1567108 RepID=A0ABW2DPB8_9BACT|nr:pectate lyase [Rufibacter roseus]